MKRMHTGAWHMFKAHASSLAAGGLVFLSRPMHDSREIFVV